MPDRPCSARLRTASVASLSEWSARRCRSAGLIALLRVTGWPPPIRAKAPSSIPLSSTAVLRAVEELGYKPNRAARSLVSQRTFTVGAVVSDLRNTWYIDLLESVRIELTAHGLNLFLAEDQQIETDASVLDAFVDAGVDGLMCLETLPPTAQLMSTAQSVPTVVVSRVATTSAATVEPMRPAVLMTPTSLLCGTCSCACASSESAFPP